MCKIKNNIIVHFTHSSSLSKIIECGFIKPKILLFPNSTGHDVDKISAFRNLNFYNKNLIKRIKQIIAFAKNSDPWIKKKYKSDDMVCLMIDAKTIFNIWVEFPKQTQELFMMGLEEIYKSEVGIYIKTAEIIPYDAVLEVI